MIKLFKRSDPEPPTPDPITPIQNEIVKLRQKQHTLHARITSEKNLILKKKLMSQEARLFQKIEILKGQKDLHDETKASQRIDALFRDPKHTLILQINGRKTKLPEDLIINLRFHPCKHRKSLHIKNTLIYQHDIGVTPTQQILLAKWRSVFSSNSTLTTQFNCQECQKLKRQKLQQQRIYSDTDIIGKCSISLTIL